MVPIDLPPKQPTPPLVADLATPAQDNSTVSNEDRLSQLIHSAGGETSTGHTLLLRRLDVQNLAIRQFEAPAAEPATLRAQTTDTQITEPQVSDPALPTLPPSTTTPATVDPTDLNQTPAEIELETDDERTVPAPEDQTPEDQTPENQTPEESTPTEQTPIEQTPAERDSEAFASELRLDADFQEYDPATQIITARGNVLLQLNDAVIEANELWVNLVNRYALAEGDVLLTRGAQLVRGSRVEYNFIQQAGVVGDAIGTIFLPALDEDLASPLEGPSSSRLAYDPIRRNPDLQIDSDGSIQIGELFSSVPSGQNDSPIRQLRFETDELAFGVEGWTAESVRITNDPFSPPEVELRADSLILRNLSSTQDELLLKRPRLVFDQGFSLPLLRSRILLSRGSINPEDLNPVPIPLGIDGRDRGGLFLGRKIPIVASDRLRFSVTPQFFITRAFSGDTSSPIDLRNFGALASFSAALSPSTTLLGDADITSFNFDEITDNIRSDFRINQQLGGHRLSLQYTYRDRLFNGSLGFQNVRSSLGAILISPTIALGDTGINLTYQASAQVINATTDRTDLLAAQNSNTDRISLGRYQGSLALGRSFTLWKGDTKPLTQDEGLRFTPEPIVPFLSLFTGLRTTSTYYSSGDSQNSLTGQLGLTAQLGHFSRNFGDYTRLSIGYSQSFIGDANSPFLFDREVDQNVLSLGITQQVYGPFLAGFQTALSFDGGQPINTIYTLEYSRRTYGILLRYDTTQNTGAIGFRLSNFNWIGDTNPFDSPRVRPVRGGVIEAR
ncbi:MAG: DUF3769 domain-containing protein [Cyanobacteria bacterium J06554_3]